MGHIVFTYCDHDANEFVTLGRTASETADALRDRFEGLREPNDPDSPFLADLWSDGECHDDDRPVSADEIEAQLGAPLDQLLSAGREQNRRHQERIRSRLALSNSSGSRGNG